MSRSFKKHQYWKFNDSDKKDKQAANQKLRTKIRIATQKAVVDEDLVFPIMREVSDNWGWASDGGPYYGGPEQQIVFHRNNRKRVKIIETRDGYRICRK